MTLNSKGSTHFSSEMGWNYHLVELVYEKYRNFQSEIGNILKYEFSQDGEHISLELGTGTGITTKIILESINLRSLVSLDVNADMLESAAKKIDTKILTLIQEDILDFLRQTKDNTFNSIISGFTIHNFERAHRYNIYKEIYRVLKPRGIFVNADKFVSDNKQVALKSLSYRLSRYKKVFSRYNEIKLLKEWIKHYEDDFTQEKRMQFGETKQLLEKIGFRNVLFFHKSEIEMLGILTAKK